MQVWDIAGLLWIEGGMSVSRGGGGEFGFFIVWKDPEAFRIRACIQTFAHNFLGSLNCGKNIYSYLDEN